MATGEVEGYKDRLRAYSDKQTDSNLTNPTPNKGEKEIGSLEGQGNSSTKKTSTVGPQTKKEDMWNVVSELQKAVNEI